MKLIQTVKNKQDIFDFMLSVDLAIKRQAEAESLNKNLIPKIYFGENKQYKKQIASEKYTRPFLTFFLSDRGPASISSSDFFSKPHQHGIFDKRTLEGGETIGVLRRDNLVKIKIRTLTQKESTILVTFMERVIMFQSGVFTSNKLQLKNIKIHEEMDGDFYLFDVYLYVRTNVIVSERDDAIFEEAEISFISVLCKHFDLTEHKCILEEAEQKEDADDLKCHSTTFCSDFEPKIEIKIKI